jgi:hypothetical protein
MTNILIDRDGKRYKIEMCKYCTDYKGRPKPILPEDMKHARKMEDGSYMCKYCHTERLLKLNKGRVSPS